MSRPDPFLNLLKDIGYLPLRLPRADVEPLQLLNLEVRTSACREVSTKPWTPVQPNCRPSRQTSLRPDRSREPTLRPSNLASAEYPGKSPRRAYRQQTRHFDGVWRCIYADFRSWKRHCELHQHYCARRDLNVATIAAAAKQIKELMEAGQVAVTTAVARSKKYIVCARRAWSGHQGRCASDQGNCEWQCWCQDNRQE